MLFGSDKTIFKAAASVLFNTWPHCGRAWRCISWLPRASGGSRSVMSFLVPLCTWTFVRRSVRQRVSSWGSLSLETFFKYCSGTPKKRFLSQLFTAELSSRSMMSEDHLAVKKYRDLGPWYTDTYWSLWLPLFNMPISSFISGVHLG